MSQRPKIALLPPETRALLDQELIRRGFGGFDDLVLLLEGHGFNISRAAVGRYSQKLQRKIETIQASTEAARAIAGITDDEDERSAAVISLVQSEMFDLLLNVQEAQEETDAAERVKLLSGAARAIADLSRASVSQKKWAQTVRERLAKAAADVTDMAMQGGLSDDLADQIRARILGIPLDA